MPDEQYDPAGFMIANTFKAIELVKLSIENDNEGLEAVLQGVPLTEVHGVLRAAVALAGQEMESARGRAAALDFCRRARPAG